MPRFSKKRMRTRRTRRTRGTKGTGRSRRGTGRIRGTGRSRRGGEGERNRILPGDVSALKDAALVASLRAGEDPREAITIHDDSVLEDAAAARGATPQSISPEEKKLNNVPWSKFPKNPFISDNDNPYAHLRPVKGGKTKRKMRKHRIKRRKTQKRRRR